MGRAENVDSATIRGLTLTAEQDFGNTTLRASADFLDPRNDDSNNQLRWRARPVYSLGVDHRIDALRLGAEYQFIGKRYNDSDNKVLIGGHRKSAVTGTRASVRGDHGGRRIMQTKNKTQITKT